MSFQKGGFISILHDEIRDITSSLLKEVSSDVTTEPLLQPLQGKGFDYITAKVEQEARVNISARGFWNRGQKSFLDIRVFNPLAPCYCRLRPKASHAMNKRDKIKYSERKIDVEQGTSTPLVFISAGGLARQSQKDDKTYGRKEGEEKKNSSLHGCDVNSFSFVMSALSCLKGTCVGFGDSLCRTV